MLIIGNNPSKYKKFLKYFWKSIDKDVTSDIIIIKILKEDRQSN